MRGKLLPVTHAADSLSRKSVKASRLRRKAKLVGTLLLAIQGAPPLLATTYYVSPNGSDSNSGTSPNAPWGSVTKVDETNFQPGDQILFQYGSTWNASLNASSSGLVSAPIVYGTYGNPKLGNPTFMGSNPISSSAFTPLTGTTYQTTYATPVNWIYDNHQFTQEAQDATESSNPATDLSFVESTPGSFYYNSAGGQLYVNTGTSLASQTITAGIRQDAINSNLQSNLVFQNLNTAETAMDNGGYGVRIQFGGNVRLLNSTISSGGKHNVGVIDGTGFVGINLTANGSAPGQGFGGASAFVAYSDANPSQPVFGFNTSSQWTNITYNNPNGPYPVMISHGGPNGVASIAINNVVSLNGYGTGFDIQSTSSSEVAIINGGQLTDNSSGFNTNNSVVSGLTVTGQHGNVSLGGSNDVLQNSTFIGASPNPGAGYDGPAIDEGFNNTIRFNTFDDVANNGPQICVTNAESNSNIYGNILSCTAGPVGQTVLQFDGTPSVQENYNLINSNNDFATGTLSDLSKLSLQQWLAEGYDTNSLVGTPSYTDLPDGIYMLTSNSPGIGLYTGTIDPSLTVANTLLGPASSNGSYNAGLNPSIWPNMNSLPTSLVLNNGQTNTITPEGNNLSIASSGSIYSSSTSTLNIVGSFSNSGTFVTAGGLIFTGNFNNSGAATFVGAQIWAPGSVFTNTAGTAVFESDAGGSIAPEEYLAVNVSGGSVTFESTQHLTSLFVGSGATVQLTNNGSSGRSILFTPSLTVTGRLDLANNDLDVESGTLAAVTALVQSGYAGGTWNGTSGIISSAAAADSTHLTALGVILNTVDGTNPLYGQGGTLGMFDGSDPVYSDILVRYTYYGDTNLDGQIDASDYARIDNGYAQHLTGWYNGDFNYDGVVNGSDYTLIDNAFNEQGQNQNVSITARIAATAIPEPAALGVFCLVVPLFFRRRRR